MSEPSRWRRGERYETCVDDGVRGSAPKLCMAYSRARCLPSSEATAHPSLPTEVESSLAPCFLLSPAKPLCWVSPGAPLEVILPRRTPALLLRPQAAQHGVSFALRELLAAPGNCPQIAAQRLDRVDRDDFSGTLQIDTIGTIQFDHTLAVASADHCSNSVLP